MERTVTRGVCFSPAGSSQALKQSQNAIDAGWSDCGLAGKRYWRLRQVAVGLQKPAQESCGEPLPATRKSRSRPRAASCRPTGMNWIFNFAWPTAPKGQPEACAHIVLRRRQQASSFTVRSSLSIRIPGHGRNSPATYTVRGEDTRCSAKAACSAPCKTAVTPPRPSL